MSYFENMDIYISKHITLNKMMRRKFWLAFQIQQGQEHQEQAKRLACHQREVEWGQSTQSDCLRTNTFMLWQSLRDASRVLQLTGLVANDTYVSSCVSLCFRKLLGLLYGCAVLDISHTKERGELAFHADCLAFRRSLRLSGRCLHVKQEWLVQTMLSTHQRHQEHQSAVILKNQCTK